MVLFHNDLHVELYNKKKIAKKNETQNIKMYCHVSIKNFFKILWVSLQTCMHVCQINYTMAPYSSCVAILKKVAVLHSAIMDWYLWPDTMMKNWLCQLSMLPQTRLGTHTDHCHSRPGPTLTNARTGALTTFHYFLLEVVIQLPTKPTKIHVFSIPPAQQTKWNG